MVNAASSSLVDSGVMVIIIARSRRGGLQKPRQSTAKKIRLMVRVVVGRARSLAAEASNIRDERSLILATTHARQQPCMRKCYNNCEPLIKGTSGLCYSRSRHRL